MTVSERNKVFYTNSGPSGQTLRRPNGTGHFNSLTKKREGKTHKFSPRIKIKLRILSYPLISFELLRQMKFLNNE